jgi:hypothetical protein
VNLWSEYIQDIAHALKVLDKFTDDLNDLPAKYSELVFTVPTRIDVEVSGKKAPFYLAQEEGAWYLRDEEG